MSEPESEIESAESCRVIVHNRYQWIGDPRLGGYVVEFDAAIPRMLPRSRRMVQGLVKPWLWLSLTRT